MTTELAERIPLLVSGLHDAIRDPSCPVEFSQLLMECARVLSRLRSPSPEQGGWSDETWKWALDCATGLLESYARQDLLATPEQRRRALDDVLQHAAGILSLALSQSPQGDQVGEDGLTKAINFLREYSDSPAMPARDAAKFEAALLALESQARRIKELEALEQRQDQ